MAPRAYWSGNLRISLVAVPVQLYSATASARKLSLHMIHEPTGKRVRYQNVVPDHGPVDRDEIVRGFEYEKNRYVLLDPEELENLKLESKKTIDIVQFVERHEIDPIYFDRPYFVVPDGEQANEAFVVVRDALRKSKKVGLGQLVLSGKENLVAIAPCGRGLLLETLRYAEEVREADQYFDDIAEVEVDDDQLDLATELIERKTGPFDPGKFKDHYREALRELVEAKLGQREMPVVEDVPSGGNVINLMDALKRSLKENQGKGGTRTKRGGSKASKGGARRGSKSRAAPSAKSSSRSAAKGRGTKRKSA